MDRLKYDDLLDAGAHFGHLRKKWNPKMAPYIFMEHKGIHIIDLNKTAHNAADAAAAMKSIVKAGKKILFVATKKQAKEIVAAAAQRVNMPFVTERWLGGMLTNFATIKRSIKKMQSIEKMLADGSAQEMTKKERLQLDREKIKLEKVLSGISSLNRTPAAVYIVDIIHENIALLEARKLGMQTFGMIDTNSDPNAVDFPIPANDDATKSISIITNYLVDAIVEGLEERKTMKAAAGEDGAETESDNEEREEKKASRPRRDNNRGGGGGDRRRPSSGGGAKRPARIEKPAAAEPTAAAETEAEAPKEEGAAE